jgi:hypothetical protein
MVGLSLAWRSLPKIQGDIARDETATKNWTCGAGLDFGVLAAGRSSGGVQIPQSAVLLLLRMPASGVRLTRAGSKHDGRKSAR